MSPVYRVINPSVGNIISNLTTLRTSALVGDRTKTSVIESCSNTSGLVIGHVNLITGRPEIVAFDTNMGRCSRSKGSNRTVEFI